MSAVMSTKERVYLLDTTLRDGAQTAGVDFSLADKQSIATLLDDLGLDYIEGGYPGANPLDTAFFARKPVTNAKFAAFGMTRRHGHSASNDPGIASLLNSAADTIVFVAKTHAAHVPLALNITLEDNLASIADSVKTAVHQGREVMLDCEHFFDGFKHDKAYALLCAQTALQAGARWLVLCDTNGGTLPDEVFAIVSEVTQTIPGKYLGIHAHDDTGQAVANSLAAVRAGARQIQGTLNGLGERCGNANLVTLIPTLLLKDELAGHYEIGVTREKLQNLTKISHTLDELLNRAPNRQAPYIGASAFATKAGIHASALMKDPSTYEHVPPESIGNTRQILISDQAGKANIRAMLERLGIAMPDDDKSLTRLLNEVKEKEALGYAYEGADASFELLARRIMHTLPTFFEIERFHINVERRYNAQGDLVTASEAVVKLSIDGESFISAAEGNGPVNALDLALRKDLGKYQRFIDDVELLDYRVRVFQGGTDAVTRVLIEFGDSKGKRWSTVGVSANIIDASFQALVDSLVYKLLKAEG